MADQIMICNNALRDIGMTPILNFMDGTPKADACRDKFPAARDAVLALHPWNFATTRRSLMAQPAAEKVTAQWAYQFQLPNNPYCLCVFAAGPQGHTTFETGNDPVHGRLLWSNAAAPLEIKFAWRVEDINVWNALAQKVLEKWLAAELAPLSTSPRANKQSLLAEAQALIPQSERADAREGTPIFAKANRTLLNARGGSGGYYGAYWS